ncbi:AbiH family protein [Sphingobacterium multivorum]|uniref:AbiH family protein n=1 Tax=Sphingobacterium multivorum TaxID=28454 RepID=UPI003DA4CA2B
MNRLILLGNGFDLAHGLKTSYNDFIKWYLRKCLGTAFTGAPFEDTLIFVEKLDYWFGLSKPGQLDDFISMLYSTNLLECENEILGVHGNIRNPYKITIKSRLLRELFHKCSYNTWVDVENDFYEMLKEILKTNEQRDEKLNDLNNSLVAIINDLEIYLSAQKPTHLNNGYSEIFESPILQEDVVSRLLGDEQPVNTMILNFNYTSIVEEYFKGNAHNPQPKVFQINYIHGRLNRQDNPMIFGFGDELDEDYKTIELEKSKGFLKFIKSFWYFKTTNYHELLRFIGTDKYQIFILGHSCGLSDRTMLNMLFEHENCESVKIFYYDNGKGYNNHEDLTYEISRHFKDKSRMRRLIVPKSRSRAMPQVEIPELQQSLSNETDAGLN